MPQTFYCWMYHFSCRWCLYMDQFTFGNYVLAISAYIKATRLKMHLLRRSYPGLSF